jgi:primosomal protein N' (replication factor Y)
MAKTNISYAVIAVGIPSPIGSSDGLTYRIPPEFLSRVQTGCRVLVPLGKREVTGVIVEITDQYDPAIKKIKDITDVLDETPVFDELYLQWTKWMAEYYIAGWGETLEAALPEGLRPHTKLRVRVVSPPSASELESLRRSSPQRAKVLERIASYPSGVLVTHLQKRHKLIGAYAHTFALEADGFVTVERPVIGEASERTERIAELGEALRNDTAKLTAALQSLDRSPAQSKILLRLLEAYQLRPDEPMSVRLLTTSAGVTSAAVQKLVEKGFVSIRSVPMRMNQPSTADHISSLDALTLTPEQKLAFDTISRSLTQGESATYLLHGITGSGKTEIYIAAAQQVIAEGGSVLVLVPEISLTPQLIERFASRLRDVLDTEIAVLHSKMPQNERIRSWKRIHSGAARLVIGARSAIFAPLKNIRLIVVDEEHETSFKQYDTAPRYHTRDAAVMRGHLAGAVTILGSATPSVESYYNAERGKYKLLELAMRAQDARLPEITIVDMRSAPRRKEQLAQMPHISDALLQAITERLARKEGVVLLQNRRGYATYLVCSECGESVMCPNCSVTLTYHRSADHLGCHYCGYKTLRPKLCPSCKSGLLFEGGVGTERVEDELHQRLPNARVLRLDLDTTARRGAMEKILKSFANREADILLGTQMVAKGLDFPHVTLVGVISADTSLMLPDFRASERTFALLTQVAGRSGRKDLEGEVLIQTMQPHHRAIVLAKEHNYHQFYIGEIRDRSELMYPPLSRFIVIEFRGQSERSVREQAESFGQLLPLREYIHRLGPAPAALGKLRGEYRWHITLKDSRTADASGAKVRELLRQTLQIYYEKYALRSVKVTIDIDAQDVR